MSLFDSGWRLKDILTYIRRLECHHGFPTGLALQCPIWGGDKFHYLQSVPAIVLPTIKIPLDAAGGIEQYGNEIAAWMSKYPSNNGYIWKAPFTQNQLNCPVKPFSTLGELVNDLRPQMTTSDVWPGRDSNNKSDLFPYVMGQKRAYFYQSERKVLLLDGRPVGFNKSSSTNKSAATDDIEAKFFTFAKNAIVLLKEKCPNSIVDGLTRVDIFQMDADANNLKVNEFESLDANFGSLESVELEVQRFLDQYWLKKLDSLINTLPPK